MSFVNAAKEPQPEIAEEPAESTEE
jgi:hypothetical protein